MNIKIICENESCVVPDQSEESIRTAMKLLGYKSFSQSFGLQFCRSVGSFTRQARAIIEPTDEPLTKISDSAASA